MALTQSQRAMIEKACSSSGYQGVKLSEEAGSYLVAVIAHDLGVANKIRGLPKALPSFFDVDDISTLVLSRVKFFDVLEQLVELQPDADTFFVCLANLHKRRLKYQRILQTQPIPTIEQVGPRGLLQYGTMSVRALTALVFWRKWFFDIDNRAGQETGYLFEPILAHAIGGVAYSAKKSPIRRANDSAKGRQVDCIRRKHAYEFKIRVTIASSGQGRWREELEFPVDCRESGYSPMLIVLDSTPNAKLKQLEAAFKAQKGKVYLGESAWEHLEKIAGPTMSYFLEKYVREPIQSMLSEVPDPLPDFTARMTKTGIQLVIGDESIRIKRSAITVPEGRDPLPEDVSDEVPGP